MKLEEATFIICANDGEDRQERKWERRGGEGASTHLEGRIQETWIRNTDPSRGLGNVNAWMRDLRLVFLRHVGHDCGRT